MSVLHWASRTAYFLVPPREPFFSVYVQDPPLSPTSGHRSVPGPCSVSSLSDLSQPHLGLASRMGLWCLLGALMGIFPECEIRALRPLGLLLQHSALDGTTWRGRRSLSFRVCLPPCAGAIAGATPAFTTARAFLPGARASS